MNDPLTRDEILAAVNNMIDDAERRGTPVEGFIAFTTTKSGIGRYYRGTVSTITLESISEFVENMWTKLVKLDTYFPHKPSDN